MLAENCNIPEEKCRQIARDTAAFMAKKTSSKKGFRAIFRNDKKRLPTTEEFTKFHRKISLEPEYAMEFFYRTVFRAYDEDENGYLESNEIDRFINVFYETGSIFKTDYPLPDKKQLKATLLKDFDENQDGKLEFEGETIDEPYSNPSTRILLFTPPMNHHETCIILTLYLFWVSTSEILPVLSGQISVVPIEDDEDHDQGISAHDFEAGGDDNDDDLMINHVKQMPKKSKKKKKETSSDEDPPKEKKKSKKSSKGEGDEGGEVDGESKPKKSKKKKKESKPREGEGEGEKKKKKKKSSKKEEVADLD